MECVSYSHRKHAILNVARSADGGAYLATCLANAVQVESEVANKTWMESEYVDKWDGRAPDRAKLADTRDPPAPSTDFYFAKRLAAFDTSLHSTSPLLGPFRASSSDGWELRIAGLVGLLASDCAHCARIDSESRVQQIHFEHRIGRDVHLCCGCDSDCVTCRARDPVRVPVHDSSL